MINVNNKFNNTNLEIHFSNGYEINNDIIISISNDINFKNLIDYLLQIIPQKEKLEITFDDFSEEWNMEKLNLIKETIIEIYEKFNSAIINENKEVSSAESTSILEDKDLPF